MVVRFHSPHRGIMGAIVPLPAVASEIVERWDGCNGRVETLMAELVLAFPSAALRHNIENRSISLRIPAEGYPAHLWKVISYDRVASRKKGG